MNREIRKVVRKRSVKRRLNHDQEEERQPLSGKGEFLDELLIEILSSLPVKSLCRFKCVCKAWWKLLSDTQFVKLHINKSITANRVTYTLYDEYKFPIRLELDHEAVVNGQKAKPTADVSLFGPEIRNGDHWKSLLRHNNTGEMEVWGCCNGVLCILASPNIMVLANPSTRETKTITRRRRRFPIDSVGGGFGYDAVNDDYKIVKINPYIRTVRVYSLRKDSWSCLRKFRNMNLIPPITCLKQGVHLNGAIHWLGYQSKDGQELVYITAFDLTKQEFFHIPTPIAATVNGIDYDHYLNVVGGCLCVTVRDQYYMGRPISDFWVMEKYGVEESWKNSRLSFSYHSLRALDLNFPNTNEALYLVGVSEQLFLYNLRDGSRKEVNIGPIPGDYASFSNGLKLNTSFAYVESLVSLGQICGSNSRKRQMPRYVDRIPSRPKSKRPKNRPVRCKDYQLV
ncbi:hypothetical protein COLO4_10239 [Corchorus olitorius]|uniref:F-box domain-containing protein n=1 Tax=Corchorus olitorius TaxID=93759 RepID=A0A1R3K9L4_9ROSI|nr:hypothetical protein COLO4_10239 [Corchorus olitorius]